MYDALEYFHRCFVTDIESSSYYLSLFLTLCIPDNDILKSYICSFSFDKNTYLSIFMKNTPDDFDF